jgi:peptidoglycan biosynthesis protein MviN/MurJ (putative lipid II flippase)
LLVSLPLAVGGMLLASRIIILLYHEQFAPAIPAMQILVWGLPAMFLLEMTGRISITLHREKILARVSILNLLIGIILSVILIPRLGIIGAAIAMVTNQWLRVLMESLIIGPALLYRGNVAPLLRVIGAGVVMGGGVWLSGNSSFLLATNDKIGLLLMMSLGVVIYGAAAFLLGAISPGETRYMYGVIRRRLGQLELGNRLSFVQ